MLPSFHKNLNQNWGSRIEHILTGVQVIFLRTSVNLYTIYSNNLLIIYKYIMRIFFSSKT